MSFKKFLTDFKNESGLIFGISSILFLIIALILLLTFSELEKKQRKAEKDALWKASLEPPLSEVNCNDVANYYDRCFHLPYEPHIQLCKDRLLPKVLNCQQTGIDQ